MKIISRKKIPKVTLFQTLMFCSLMSFSFGPLQKSPFFLDSLNFEKDINAFVFNLFFQKQSVKIFLVK